jgi:hypothetical protein
MLSLQLIAKPLKACQRRSAFRQHKKGITYEEVFFNCGVPSVMANANSRVIWHVI